MKGRLSKLLDSALWFLFAGVVFFWFKGNFPFLDRFRISPLLPLSLLSAGLFYKFWGARRKERRSGLSRIRIQKSHIAVILLLLLAVVLRIPFLSHGFGLMTSDHAIPSLMGKHISEGNLPPVYYYGQFYMGSLSEHFFALVFLLFGYSVFALKLSTLLFFLAFIAVQFVFMEEVFGFDFSFFVCLFYCLPLGHLITVSFDNTSAYSLVLFLGSLLLYLSYRVTYKDKDSLISIVGFLMGLSFWTHQISIVFIVTSFAVLAVKFRLRIKKYAALAVYATIGCLPVVVLEILEGFPLLRFLSPQGSKIFLAERMERAAGFIVSLLSLKETPLNFFFLILLALGLGVPFYFAFKTKKIPPQGIFSFFFVIFLFIYVFSDFSDIKVIRYLYPLYFCLPVLLLSFSLFIKAKIKFAFVFGLIAFIFFFNNFKEQREEYRLVKGTDQYLRRVVDKMEETGKKYWRGEYWSAYLLSALSAERIVVDSSTQNRYFPYRLDYFNQGENNNFVFLRGEGYEANVSQRLVEVLDAVGLGYRKIEIGDSRLIFDVEDTVFPPGLKSPPPPILPSYVLKGLDSSSGFLRLDFQNKEPVQGFHLRTHVEIPSFSAVARAVSWEREEFELAIPFPDRESFQVRVYFDYNGLRFPASEKVFSYSPQEGEFDKRSGQAVVRLLGFGPVVSFEGKKLFLCEKEARLEVNRKLEEGSRLKLYLYSPFRFYHFFWYGDHSQEVRIEIDGVVLAEKKLNDGENCIEIELEDGREFDNPCVISLKFKYHMPFDFAVRWKTAALFDRIEIQ